MIGPWAPVAMLLWGVVSRFFAGGMAWSSRNLLCGSDTLQQRTLIVALAVDARPDRRSPATSSQPSALGGGRADRLDVDAGLALWWDDAPRSPY